MVCPLDWGRGSLVEGCNHISPSKSEVSKVCLQKCIKKGYFPMVFKVYIQKPMLKRVFAKVPREKMWLTQCIRWEIFPNLEGWNNTSKDTLLLGVITPSKSVFSMGGTYSTYQMRNIPLSGGRMWRHNSEQAALGFMGCSTYGLGSGKYVGGFG